VKKLKVLGPKKEQACWTSQ